MNLGWVGGGTVNSMIAACPRGNYSDTSHSTLQKKCQDLPVKHDFKLNPTLKTLKSWWASETVTAESKVTAISSSRRKNLLADLGSDRDSDNETTSRKKKKTKSKPQKEPKPSTSSSLTSSDEKQPPPKKSASKRKAPQLELSDDDLGVDEELSGTSVWSP